MENGTAKAANDLGDLLSLDDDLPAAQPSQTAAPNYLQVQGLGCKALVTRTP